MAKRINLVLEDKTAETIRRSAKPGERSRFVNRAVQYYAATRGTEAVVARLKEAAIRDRDLAADIARDWFAVDNQPWQNEGSEGSAKRPFPGEERSIW